MNQYRLEGEAKKYFDTVVENVGLLVSGWRERIDYVVPVAYHRNTCSAINRVTCECPVTQEKRSRQLLRPSLIEQLETFRESRDVSREPKAERQAPRVKKIKNNPEHDGFFALDEITCDVYMTVDKFLEEGGKDRLSASLPIREVLLGIVPIVGEMADEHTDLVHDLSRATSKWVASARRTLNLSVSDAMFGETVCGNCNGGLVVAWDNASDVRCIGTPSKPPCGHTYPMSEWIALYEKGRRDAHKATAAEPGIAS